MKRGELAKKKRKGCLTALLVVWAVFMVKVIAVLNPGFLEAWRMVEAYINVSRIIMSELNQHKISRLQSIIYLIPTTFV